MSALSAMAAPMAAMPEFREARFTDHAGIMAVESSQGLNERSYEEWTALWTRNPVYQQLDGKWPIGWVLENAGGEIVGSTGNIPAAYVLEGKQYLSAIGRAWAVKPEARAFALLLLEEFFAAQPDVQLFLNTTVNDQAVESFTSFGSARPPVGDMEHAAYWITSYRGFAGAALRLKEIPADALLSIPAGMALWMKDRVGAKRLAPSRLTASFVERFDERFDIFWQALMKTKAHVLLGVRDRAALDWHFGPKLERGKLWIAAIMGASGMIAYGLFQRKDHDESGLTRMRLVDFQAIEQIDECLRAILHLAMERCGRESIHTLEQVGLGLPGTGLIDAHAPYRRSLPAWPYYYMAAGPLAKRLRDAGVWEPSSFDGDSSL